MRMRTSCSLCKAVWRSFLALRRVLLAQRGLLRWLLLLLLLLLLALWPLQRLKLQLLLRPPLRLLLLWLRLLCRVRGRRRC